MSGAGAPDLEVDGGIKVVELLRLDAFADFGNTFCKFSHDL